MLEKVKDFMKQDINESLKAVGSIFQSKKDVAIETQEKAIGAGFQTVGTNLPPADGGFLSFINIASEEDGSSRKVQIRNPYLQNAWVFSATRVMAENLAQVPFILT
ncbi:hypothetical protein LCGC14_2428850, partial [marine sediment metagenome]